MFEYLFGVLTGVSANAVTKVIEALWGGNKAYAKEEEIEVSEEKSEQKEKEDSRQFQTFHIKTGFESILNFVQEPIVHMVVESEPTTAWHLVILIVESRVTGEWYVSQKGEMAFEGSGGGLYVAEKVATICRNRRITTAGWVLSKEDSDSLARGIKTWPQLKINTIPLVSYSKNDYFIKYVAKKFQEVNT